MPIDPAATTKDKSMAQRPSARILLRYGKRIIATALGTFLAATAIYEIPAPRRAGTGKIAHSRQPAPEGFNAREGLAAAYLELAAYEMGISKIVPQQGDRLILGNETYTVKAPLLSGDKFLGYIADGPRATHIVIRGSRGPEFFQMLASRYEDFYGEGRTTMFYATRAKDIWQTAKPLAAASSKPIEIDGHSIGTAIGDLVATRIVQETGKRPIIYGFQSEGAGDQEFHRRFESDGIEQYNFVNPLDVLDLDAADRNGNWANSWGMFLKRYVPNASGLGCPSLGFDREGDTFIEEFQVDGKYLPRDYGIKHMTGALNNHRIMYEIDAYVRMFPEAEGSTFNRIGFLERDGQVLTILPSPFPTNPKIETNNQHGWLRPHRPKPNSDGPLLSF